jgi:drug/metabolite transporter (DMT)-like permease
LAIFWLKTPIARGIWLAVLLGFLGIIVIIHPNKEIFTEAGNFIGLGSGISLAIAYMLMKLLTPTDPAARIILYYLGVGTLIQLPLLFFAGPFPPINSCWFSFIAGITLVLSQFMLVRAYSYAEASQVGVFQYSSVVFVGILDWLIWNNIPPPLDLLGVTLVAVAGVIIIYSGNKQTTKQ